MSFTDEQRDKYRQSVARDLSVVAYKKEVINAALSGIDVWFDTVKQSGSQFIDSVTEPFGFTFTNTQKLVLFEYWLELEFMTS